MTGHNVTCLCLQQDLWVCPTDAHPFPVHSLCLTPSGFFSEFSSVPVTWWFLFLWLHFLASLTHLVSACSVALTVGHCLRVTRARSTGLPPLQEAPSREPATSPITEMGESCPEFGVFMAPFGGP